MTSEERQKAAIVTLGELLLGAEQKAAAADQPSQTQDAKVEAEKPNPTSQSSQTEDRLKSIEIVVPERQQGDGVEGKDLDGARWGRPLQGSIRGGQRIRRGASSAPRTRSSKPFFGFVPLFRPLDTHTN